MQRVKLASALRAAIISIAFMRGAPVLADENKFVFVPQEDSPGNDYHRLDNPLLKTVHKDATPRDNVTRLPLTSFTTSVS
jgi:hypothetical protein